MIMRQKENSDLLPFLKTKRAVAGVNVQWLRMVIFREREDSFSLGFRSIGPSVFDGARRKVALRGED